MTRIRHGESEEPYTPTNPHFPWIEFQDLNENMAIKGFPNLPKVSWKHIMKY